MIKMILAQLAVVTGITAGVYVYGEHQEARAVQHCVEAMMHRPQFRGVSESALETSCRLAIMELSKTAD